MAVQNVLDLIQDENLIDKYKDHYPVFNTIYLAQKNPLKQARLDFCLIIEELANKTVKFDIDSG